MFEYQTVGPSTSSWKRCRSEAASVTTPSSKPGGTPIAFDGDGKFEFKDANGEGEGTYGIDALSVVMVVRDYDGPNDSYSAGVNDSYSGYDTRR